MLNLAIFYDTETTGIPMSDQPIDDPGQPHIVQLGASLVDVDTRQTISSIDVIVRPDGWTIPERAAAVHGITTEMTADVGVPEKDAVVMLLEMWKAQRLRIGHNEKFDATILRIACERHARLCGPAWSRGAAACTAVMATPVLKLPPTERMRAAGRLHFKTPNLGEAYRWVTGQDLVGAHSAMVDVQACATVYFGLERPEGAAS